MVMLSYLGALWTRDLAGTPFAEIRNVGVGVARAVTRGGTRLADSFRPTSHIALGGRTGSNFS